jgi:hypothetical protein
MTTGSATAERKEVEEGRSQVVISPLLGRKKRDDEQLGQ